MREIKFRGKRIDNGDWIFGNFIFDEEWQKAYISYPKKGAVYITLKSDEVDAKTVGQFTGLLDKEKKEIYEGDIVRRAEYALHDPRKIAQVYWDGVIHGWQTRSEPCRIGNKHLGPSSEPIADDCEIIGNIYENPELLGVK